MPGFAINHQGEACGDGAPGGDAGDVPSATDEYARKHRFELRVFDPLQDILIYAHRCGRPRPEIDRIAIHRSQEEIYSPGKHRWRPIEIQFYENVQANAQEDRVASRIYDWWSSQVLDLNLSTITTEEFKKDCELGLLDGEINVIWRYSMYGCWPSKIDPDDLDYSDTALAEISFTLEMDKAQEVLS